MRVAANNLKILFQRPKLLVRNDQANWSHGVTVSTQDSESCDPRSNLGGTWFYMSLSASSEFVAFVKAFGICDVEEK